MANNEPQAVEDVEEKKVVPAPETDNPDDYVPLAPAPGGTDNPPAPSASEPTPGDQPAEATPAPSEPVASAEGEQPKEPAAPAPAAAEPVKDDDVTLLAQGLKDLAKDRGRLPGETPVEFARRLEILRLRMKAREAKGEELLGGVKPAPAPVAPAEIPAEDEDIDPDEVQRFAKIAKRAGYIPQAEADKQSYDREIQSVFSTWASSSPEFDESNDPDGILWGRLKAEFNSGLYNTRPKNPQDLSKILDNIKKDILGIQPTSNLSKVTAQQEKIKVASHAGASPGGSASAPEDKSSSAKKALLQRGLKGFSDEEIEELAKE